MTLKIYVLLTLKVIQKAIYVYCYMRISQYGFNIEVVPRANLAHLS